MTCDVDGCVRKHYGRGLCQAHYQRARRSGGDPGRRGIGRLLRPRCSVDGCARPHSGRGYCQAHRQRVVKHGDPLAHVPILVQDGARPTYATIHDRLSRQRGSASDNQCARCVAVADEWAYDHQDPDALTSAEGPYSVDLQRYLPLCRPCHRRFDGRREASGRRRLDVARCVELYRQGLGCELIAKEVGFSPSTVLRGLRRSGVQLRPGFGGPRRRGITVDDMAEQMRKDREQ